MFLKPGQVHPLHLEIESSPEDQQTPHLDGLEVQHVQSMSSNPRKLGYCLAENVTAVRPVDPPSPLHKPPILLRSSLRLVAGLHEHREPACRNQTYQQVIGLGHLVSEFGVGSMILQKT